MFRIILLKIQMYIQKLNFCNLRHQDKNGAYDMKFNVTVISVLKLEYSPLQCELILNFN